MLATLTTGSLPDAIAGMMMRAGSIVVDRIHEEGAVRSHPGCKGYRSGQKTKDCVFPYIYRGVVFTSCTIWNDNQYWCPTEVDPLGNYITEKWGYCSADCPFSLPNCKTKSGPQVRLFFPSLDPSLLAK